MHRASKASSNSTRFNNSPLSKSDKKEGRQSSCLLSSAFWLLALLMLPEMNEMRLMLFDQIGGRKPLAKPPDKVHLGVNGA